MPKSGTLTAAVLKNFSELASETFDVARLARRQIKSGYYFLGLVNTASFHILLLK